MATKLIKSDEMLQVFCDEFLISIANRKKKAREVKDIRSCYRTEKYYVINSSRKDHQGWVFELDSRTDTWMFFDCVICGSVICGSDCVCTYYWLNNFDRVKVNQQNEISIRVDDYEYVSTKDDNPRKRNILLLLVAKLEELFKQ
nr:MAG TPA: hypothetical protein [Caudoviricetes sp.]